MAFPTYTTATPTQVIELTVTLRKGQSAEGDTVQHTAEYRISVLDQDGREITDFPWVRGSLIPYLEGTEAQQLQTFMNNLISRAETALGITT